MKLVKMEAATTGAASVGPVHERTAIMTTDYQRERRWLLRIRQFNLVCYCVAFAGVLLGLAVGFSGLVTAGARVAAGGAVLIMMLCIESYVVLPFVKCPHCAKPFFRRGGLFGSRVPLLNRECIHCGFTARGDRLALLANTGQPQGSASRNQPPADGAA
jgi:hypothetical protein